MTRLAARHSALLSFALLFSLSVLFAACSNRRSTACTPGTSIACACSSGMVGTQTCGSDSVYSACNCLGEFTDGGETTDGSIADASMDASVVPTDSGSDSGAPASDGSVDAGTDSGIARTCLAVGECNDGNACTADDCISGHCVNVAINVSTFCDDRNLCTTESCDSRTGCVHTNNTVACSDGEYCTINDACSGGVCRSDTLRACGAGCVCNETDDSCEAVHPGTACRAVEEF